MKDIKINPDMNLGIQSPLEAQGDLYENETNERAKSKSQQRFFGMVDAYKKGELKNASKSVKDAAKGMSMKQVKDFAKTKHKGLPNHVDESYMSTQNNSLVDALNNSKLYENKTKMKKNTITIKESQLREIIKECIQQHLVDMLGKYTQGKATSKQTNKAIMDFADSSNTGRKKINEDAWMPDDMAPYNEQQPNVDTVNYEFETIPFIFACMQDNAETQEIEFMKQHMDELSTLPSKIGYWAQYAYDMEQDPDEVGAANKINENIDDEEFYFKDGTNEILVSDWLQQNEMNFNPEVTKQLNYIVESMQFSTLNEVEQFMGYIKRLINSQQPLNESYAEDLHYTHFAVNKQTNKIVNGWDYSGKDGAELRQFKQDYFMKDLADNGLNPENYTILTVSGCKRRGINPFDDSNWTNDDYFNAYTQPLY